MADSNDVTVTAPRSTIGQLAAQLGLLYDGTKAIVSERRRASACGQLQAAGVGAEAALLPQRQMSTVLRELNESIVVHLSLADLAYVSLRLNRQWRAATRARLEVLRSKWQPLLDEPFGLSARDVLNVERLYLVCKHVGDDGLRALAHAGAIGALAKLDDLNLASNRIGDGGMQALATAVASGALANLQKLYLHQNQIGDDGITALAEALKSSSGALTNLERLYLENNKVGDVGMIALADMLKSSKGSLEKLTFLNLESNKIGDPGMAAFGHAIGSGALASLRALYVDDGALGTEHPQLQAACSARGIRLL